MSVRSFLNNNPAVMTIAAIVVLLICLAVIYSNLAGGGGSGRIVDLYYYDTGTGELFSAPANSIAPIDAPSGPGAGVRAHVYTCGGCNSDEWTIAYLEKFDDQARDALVNAPESPEAAQAYDSGLLVRNVDGDTWHQVYSTEGMRVSEALATLCAPGQLKPCLP
ncbi:MAG: hypothetical protein AAF586_08755 [Planctomycetota bacterium]